MAAVASGALSFAMGVCFLGSVPSVLNLMMAGALLTLAYIDWPHRRRRGRR